MRYLEVLENLLGAIEDTNYSEVIDFSMEFCNLVSDKIKITNKECEIAFELLDELDKLENYSGI